MQALVEQRDVVRRRVGARVHVAPDDKGADQRQQHKHRDDGQQSSARTTPCPPVADILALVELKNVGVA